MTESKKMNLLFDKLEKIQKMILTPTIFDDKLENELNLSDKFVDSHVVAYALVDELLSLAASSRATYAQLIARWKTIKSGSDGSEYAELSESEFGRVVLYLIESALRLK